LLLPTDVEPACHKRHRGRSAYDDRGGARGSLRLMSERVGSEPIYGRPRRAAGNVAHHERQPGHTIGARKQRSDRPQQHDEARHDDDHDPILAEQDAAVGDPPWREANGTAVPAEQPETDDIADPATCSLTRDRTQCSRDDDRDDVQLMRRAGYNGGAYQQALPGQRQPEALQADDDSQDSISIGVEQLDQIVERDRAHTDLRRLTTHDGRRGHRE
jgi:hypothetical protein